MPKLHLWYQQTDPGAIEDAYAFAAAGALTAANWNHTEPLEDALQGIIQAASDGPIGWKLPDVSLQTTHDISDRALARAWRHGFEHYSETRNRTARLIVDMSSLGYLKRHSLGGAVTLVSRRLAAPSMEQTPAIVHRSVQESLQAGDIASVAFAGFRQAYSHEWSWPLQVGIQSSQSWADHPFAQVRAARHGFLDLTSPAPGRQDVFMVTDPELNEPAISALTESPLGVTLLRMPPTTPMHMRNQLLRHWVTDDYMAPAVFFDVRREFAPEFLSAFTYELARNRPLDVAAFSAYAEVWSRQRAAGMRRLAPPVVFAPIEEPAGIFEESRLGTRVNEMAGRLRRLPGDAVIDLPMEHAYSLGMTREPGRTARQMHDELTEAYAANRVDFSREVDAASALRSLNEAVSAVERAIGPERTIFKSEGPSAPTREKPAASTQVEGAPATAATQREEPATATGEQEANRFTDVTLYAGKLFKGDDLGRETRVADDAPLVGGNHYTIEVAIRLRRTGIAAEQTPDRRVRNPRTDREDLTVYVEAKCVCEGVVLEDGLQVAFKPVTWPYNADSKSVLFQLTTTPLASGTRKEATIEINLYHHSLDLLDTVRVPITLVATDLATETLPVRKLAWPQLPGVPWVEVDSPERLASITVSTRPGGGYRFDFKFRERSRSEKIIPAVRVIEKGDLEALLEKVRDFWTRLIIGVYSEQLSVSGPTFRKKLADLVTIGRSAARLLFGDPHAAQPGSGQTIGRLLADMPRAEGELLQIFYSDDARNFVFPWNLIYPSTSSEEVDPNEFWGMRYQIEQVRDGPKIDALTDEPINITFTLDPKFGDSQAQKDLLAGYQSSSRGKIIVSQPIQEANHLFAALGAQPASHLYYFFCHGWAPHGGGTLAGDSRKRIEEEIEGLDERGKKTWETLLALLPQMGTEAWLFIGSSQVLESTLLQQKFFDPARRPIVFLNACQSAGLLPSMNSGLARVFLERNASAVIGTESPMTPVFAHPFAKKVLDELLSGKDVGTALRLARGRFMTADNNPLGLAYTLYGRSTARLGAGPVLPPAPPIGTGGIREREEEQ